MRIFFIAALLLSVTSAPAQSAPFVVHEWGTFTSLQDELGRTIGGINTDDEPVPSFVHDLLAKGLVGKGGVRVAPAVTMRLETPVLYVYPGAGWAGQKLNVAVEFRGGWLSQFYPKAEAPGGTLATVAVTAKTLGKLSWKNLTVGGARMMMQKTDAHVWLAPRKPDSALLSTAAGETEKYLFYRGIGHVEAPLRVARVAGDLRVSAAASESFGSLWYCEFRADGTSAWRRVPAVRPGAPALVPAAFSSADFSADNLILLKYEMREALIAEGLYAAEAEAMLDTWEASYFKSWGARVFYIVPNSWTEAVLPLRVTPQPSELHRVMVGRIDLVTPAHRALLQKIVSAPSPKQQQTELWQAYNQLGRFRNALVLDEQRRRPSTAIDDFINGFILQGVEK